MDMRQNKINRAIAVWDFKLRLAVVQVICIVASWYIMYRRYRRRVKYHDRDLVIRKKKVRQDRAMDQKAKTAKERLKEKDTEAFDETNDDQLDSIDRINRMASQNDITLDNFTVGDDDVQMVSSEPRSSASTSKGKKRRNSFDAEREQLKSMVTSLSDIATAIREAATEVSMALRPQKLYKPAEIHEALTNIGLDSRSRLEAYVYLSKKVERLEAFFGFPVGERKELLDFMMLHEEL